MSVLLRTNDVSTTDVSSPLERLTQFLCWLPLTVPMGFDASAGDYLTFTIALRTAAAGLYPDTFQVFVDFTPMQLDGGALNAGPYSGSGFSYTAGRQFANYGYLHGDWTTPGARVLNHDSPGQTEFATNQYVSNVTAGAGGFAGEGVIISSLPETEVAGWNAQREFRQTIDTSLPLLAGTVFTLECYLQVIPSDATHPDRSMRLELTSASMTWVPFVGTPATTAINLATAQVGFNTGSAGAAPGLFGPYTYNALRTVELTPPPVSDVMQDLYRVQRQNQTRVAMNYRSKRGSHHLTPSPLSVSISPASQIVSRTGAGPISTDALGVPAGGRPPYGWAFTGGGLTVTGGTTQNPGFSTTLTEGQDTTYDIEVTLTDSAGTAPATNTATIEFKANSPTPPPDFIVSNSAELTTAMGLVAAGQVIACEAGDYAGLDFNGKTFTPAITITSADLLNRASLNYFNAALCTGLTFAHIDFVVTLPAFYGWKFDTCTHITMNDVIGRSNSAIPVDYENCAGMRFFGCSQVLVEDSEYYHLNGCLQFGLGTDTFSVLRNKLHDLNADGVDIGLVSNGLIDSNYIHDFHVTGGNHPDAVQFTADTSNITISNNLVWRGSGDGTQGFFAGDGAHTNPTAVGNLIVGTGTSALRFIGCTNATIDANELVTYVGAPDPTNILVQFSDIVAITNNQTVAGAIGTGTSTNVTQSGNTTIPAVSDQGAAAIAAWRLLNPTVPT